MITFCPNSDRVALPLELEMANVPPEDQMRVASKVKENYSYVCQDIVKEFRKYDSDPYNMFQRYTSEYSVTGKVWLPH